MASQITGVSSVCSTVGSHADQRKHQIALRHWPLWGETTGYFPAQRASNAENVSIWWGHHVSGSHMFGTDAWRVKGTGHRHTSKWQMSALLSWNSGCLCRNPRMFVTTALSAWWRRTTEAYFNKVTALSQTFKTMAAQLSLEKMCLHWPKHTQQCHIASEKTQPWGCKTCEESDVFSIRLVTLNCRIALKFDRHSSKYKSRGFETFSRRLFGYWDGAQGAFSI